MSKNKVSHVKKLFWYCDPCSDFHIPSCKSSLSLPQIKGGPTCGNSLETFCWIQSVIQGWSSGRIGRRGFSASSNLKRWHSYGARRKITAAWPTRNWAGPWGTCFPVPPSTQDGFDVFVSAETLFKCHWYQHFPYYSVQTSAIKGDFVHFYCSMLTSHVTNVQKVFYRSAR